jgi:ParB/RepB/Spo0J family partition protein
MATTDLRTGEVRMLPLEQIRHDRNIRDLDAGEIDALAGSIELLGQITPVLVRVDGDGYVLVAGHKRYAALAKLGHSEIRAEIRGAEGEHSERAAENIVRTQLNPREEARALQAMLDSGLSEDGAAQALGWPKARVTARVKLLELPERAQRLVGAGVISLSAVDQLRAIGRVSPELLEAVIEFLADGNEWAAERLAREPGWVLDSALRSTSSKAFAAHLTQLDAYQISELRLGKKAEQLVEEATKLHRQIDRYAYGMPAIRFSDEEVDQARAAGVLIEFEHSRPVIVDRALYRELAKHAIKRAVEELRAKVERAAAEKKRSAKRDVGTPADPLEDARREHGRRVRELAEQAHGANLDLGASLLNGLSAIDPTDMTVARFFVSALLGSDYDGSPYTQSGDVVAELAARGVRLVIEEFRTDVTKTRKDGSRGKLRIDYGDPKEPEKPIAWLWKFIDGAKTAGELYGRALVVIAAEQYASRLVVPSSQQFSSKRWPSHRDNASKALRKLASPHVPASLKQLEKAVASAKRDYERAQDAARPSSRRRSRTTDSHRDTVTDRDDMGREEMDGQGEELGDSDEEPSTAELSDSTGADGAVTSDEDATP